jgi:hypothetical protein
MPRREHASKNLKMSNSRSIFMKFPGRSNWPFPRQAAGLTPGSGKGDRPVQRLLSGFDVLHHIDAQEEEEGIG